MIKLMMLMLQGSMGTEKILTRYAAGERKFRQINLQEAELIKLNVENIDLTAADLTEAIMPDGSIYQP